MTAKLIFKIAVISMLTSGCVYGRQNTMGDDMKRSVGQNISVALRAWGEPNRKILMENGNMVYAYERSDVGYNPGYQTPSYTVNNGSPNGIQYSYGGQTYGAGQVVYWCHVYFEVNQSNVIVDGNWEGNACSYR